jgi:polyphosphate kinase 2 (PPK2 family)
MAGSWWSASRASPPIARWSAFEEIVAFEKALADDGAVFGNSTQSLEAEQRRRLEAPGTDPNERWRVKKRTGTGKAFGKYREAFDDMVKRTSKLGARWKIIPADDRRTSRRWPW